MRATGEEANVQLFHLAILSYSKLSMPHSLTCMSKLVSATPEAVEDHHTVSSANVRLGCQFLHVE